MPDTQVTLKHPKLGDEETITVSEHAVPVHEAAGWKRAPKTQQPDPAEQPKP